MSNNLIFSKPKNNSSSSPFIINLWIEASGEIFVRSCEIVGDRFRNRTSFGERATLESAFSDRMVCALKDCLSRLSQQTEVLVLPTHSIEVPELALLSPRIIATKGADGMISVIMRFKSFIGAINKAFRDEVGLEIKNGDQCSVLSAEVLGDIAAPLLNVCSALETGSSDVVEKLGAFGRKIALRSHEIGFQVELLTRFVQQQHDLMETKTLSVYQSGEPSRERE